MLPPLEIESALRETMVRILEEMAFIFTIEEGAGSPGAGPARSVLNPVTAEVRFRGIGNETGGHLRLTLPKDLLPTIVDNMLGAAAPASPVLSQQEDALKELANIVCGNFLPRLAGAGAVYHVDSPRMIGAEDLGLNSLASASVRMEDGVAVGVVAVDAASK